jgi:hypothetical protein
MRGGDGGQYILVFTDLVYEVQVTDLQIFRQIVLYMLTLRVFLMVFRYYAPSSRKWSRDSVVGIATAYGLDDRGIGVRVPVGLIIFSTLSRAALRPTQHPIQWVPGALSKEVKRLGSEADHSPPTSAEVKKM